ncbi:MAG TPA: oligosaccharide flippase family protein [Pyrinomonadaceae bacterium]|nr:oligosaccharide flippase family protein [Pyrinomonadaceae bacterium]
MNDGLTAAEGRTPVARRPFAVQIGWTLAVRLLMTANSVVAGIIVARWLGADGLGQLGVINVTVAMVVQLGSAGLPSANTYFIAKDHSQLRSVALNSLLFATIVGSLLAVALSVLAQTRPGWFGFISPELIKIAAISIPFQLVTLIGLNIFLALGNVRRFNLLDLLGQSFVMINALVALIVLHSGLTTLVTLNTAAAVAVGLIVIVLVAMYPTSFRSWRFDLNLLGRMINYGLKFHLSIVAAALMFRADLLVVNHFHGAGVAGVYSVASQVATMLMMLPGVIATLLFPRITAEQDVGGETTSRITRHTVFVMLLICLFAVPLSFLLPVLYGRPFSDATVQLLILLPGVYLIGVQSVFAQHFNAIGLPRAVPAFWVLTLLAHVALLLVLVPPLGARGAALASLLSYVMIFALMFFYFRSSTGRSSGDTLMLSAGELCQLFQMKR